MQDQSTLMSSKCDTLCAAFGIESSGTSTHLNPAGAEPGAMPPAVDGGVTTRTLVSESAADTPFLIAETSTQYVSASPIARPISGISKPSPTSAPIAESPCVSEASILAQAVCPPPATKGVASAVAAPAASELGAGIDRSPMVWLWFAFMLAVTLILVGLGSALVVFAWRGALA